MVTLAKQMKINKKGRKWQNMCFNKLRREVAIIFFKHRTNYMGIIARWTKVGLHVFLVSHSVPSEGNSMQKWLYWL